ncbi:MAG: gephyrin-like molybdotransferase Glp [Gemmataceae bacterium]
MVPVREAQTIILERVQPLPPRPFRLGATALGLTCAEDVPSDRDSPPFDKALMDGYAVRAADLQSGRAELRVIEEVTAGQLPRHAVDPGSATRIMTGAPIPAGADTVVIVEKTRLADDGRVVLEDHPSPGQNILPRGAEMRLGEKVIRAGTVMRPQEIGVLAAIGKAELQCHPRPLVTILSTGNEIVEVDRTPGPGQIRNGNGLMLLAQVQRGGGVPRSMLIVPDEKERLRLAVQQGLEAGDVVVLSGGVSAGKLDLVPGVLADAGVKTHIQKVFMKPGKPMHFGTFERKDGSFCYAFGLPGNPVSSLVCFELFVRPALRKMRGLIPGPCIVSARLGADFAYRSDRPTYYPARLELSADGWNVTPVPWSGSADLKSVLAANAFLVLPEGDKTHRAGERYPVLRVEDDWI